MSSGDREKPSDNDSTRLANWVRSDVFKTDESDPVPGLVRRIDRNESRKRIRDLMGDDYQADLLLPTDDSGQAHRFMSARQVTSQFAMNEVLVSLAVQ